MYYCGIFGIEAIILFVLFYVFNSSGVQNPVRSRQFVAVTSSSKAAGSDTGEAGWCVCFRLGSAHLQLVLSSVSRQHDSAVPYLSVQ